MKNQIQVKPQVNRLINLLQLIEDGKFKIPTFQRDFVWEDKQKIDLFDSISHEYPIGSVLLWRPKEVYSNNYQIGPYTIESYDSAEFYYILDGYQRLSTLFGCLTNPSKTHLECNEFLRIRKFNMVYDLVDEAFLIKRSNQLEVTCIPVYKLVDTYEFLDFIDQLRIDLKNDENIDTYITRAKKLSSTIIDYQIPSIEIIGGKISEAVEIFSRVNSKGIEISPDWMLSALSSNEETGFNLGEIFSNLLEDLKEYNFDGLKREILVQCIQNSFGKVYFDQTLELLVKRHDFQKVTLKTVESVKHAIKFLFEELLVIDKKLLPYGSQLIFLVHFFNHVEKPSDVQKEKLKQWFWITTYANYFTIYSLSKIREAYLQFNKFIDDETVSPVYYHNKKQKFTTADLPKSVSSGSVRSKAFQLFLLNTSNDFKKLDSNDVAGYKIEYLFKGRRSHSSYLPFIHFKNTYGSNKYPSVDISFKNEINVASKINFKSGGLNRKEDIDYYLIERLKYIVEKEKVFVDGLGISYQKISL
ncbi:DUF262 domain-containing protein [Plebeiibacterium sediminum]|uniref:DUF262 domain-containing protein n=1 Tax=Plebeiibacterium sediminum TaxID=2992112 RepID=A0AAE3M5Q0_9BACT|nr:DUF262 domain-containing protein [Plebeiobacterium sediminum]MCW3787649.1 DUF262 domain-containing protein [Plebeiobacterium sediminum]